MIILFKLIILTTMWCLGMKIVTADHMIFAKIGKYARQKVEEGKSIYDPLIACEWCMPSIHSLIGYSFAIGIGLVTSFSWSLVVMYPLVVIGSSIGTGMIWSAYLTMNSAKERNESQTDFYDGLYDEQCIVNEFQNHN
jgi:hypothetical protein